MFGIAIVTAGLFATRPPDVVFVAGTDGVTVI
jgi:hypothetical protein